MSALKNARSNNLNMRKVYMQLEQVTSNGNGNGNGNKKETDIPKTGN